MDSSVANSDVVMSTRIVPASLKNFRYSALRPSQTYKLNFSITTCSGENAFTLHSGDLPRLCFCSLVRTSSISVSKKMAWSIRSSADSSDLNSSGNSASGRTRLVRIIQDLLIKVEARIQGIKNGFPMKLLLFLVGFYCATAFSTVIGQTGDWDVLSAALAVIVLEGIGALMYNTSFPLLNKIRGLITMFNYWKAGLSLALFLDAFKYEIDDNMGLPNPFSFILDVFLMFL
ncbi:hypothetical protein RJ639_027807 [Escallonia herrerae]|uniref:Ycf20-like protein n=1 Tax=Escallonia herrerae TaxID=1293975 RepID=A0AA89BQE1_9ASTE|nr:hypothetical protein RJ639_027807 [Escallonia herrerae]